MQNLATKYRPKQFSDLVGQEDEVGIFVNVLEQGHAFPSYILSGPFGAGKTTAARIFANALLCDARPLGKAEPCGSCHVCLAFTSDSPPPSLTEVDAASTGSVEAVRSLLNDLRYKLGAKRRVVLLDEAHNLTKNAQNSLLKTLEEGNPREVTFLMVTNQPDALLATVRSRSVHIQLRLLTTVEVLTRLSSIATSEKISHESTALRLIATASQGHLRDAIVTLQFLVAAASGPLTEGIVRKFLRLDSDMELLKVVLESPSDQLDSLEQWLAKIPPRELIDSLAEGFISSWKQLYGISPDTDAEKLLLTRISKKYTRDELLAVAERLLLLPANFRRIQHAAAVIVRHIKPSQEEQQVQKDVQSFTVSQIRPVQENPFKKRR